MWRRTAYLILLLQFSLGAIGQDVELRMRPLVWTGAKGSSPTFEMSVLNRTSTPIQVVNLERHPNLVIAAYCDLVAMRGGQNYMDKVLYLIVKPPMVSREQLRELAPGESMAFVWNSFLGDPNQLPVGTFEMHSTCPMLVKTPKLALRSNVVQYTVNEN